MSGVRAVVVVFSISGPLCLLRNPELRACVAEKFVVFGRERKKTRRAKEARAAADDRADAFDFWLDVVRMYQCT